MKPDSTYFFRHAACFITFLALAIPAPSQEPAASQPDKAPPAFAEEKITVQSGSFKLKGLLTLPIPETDQKLAAVVLVHGSGPHDYDETIGPNKPFRDLARGLARRGIACVRYEKRTLKYGLQMTLADMNLDWEVIDDALAAAKLACEHPRIDPARVFILGHSLGGTAAPLIVARDSKLAGFISLCGTPRSLLDLVDEQMDYILRVDGKLTKDEERQLKDIHQTTSLIREGKLDEIKIPLLGAPSEYWQHLHQTDVLTPAKNCTRPMLFIGGGRDYQVSQTCFDAWKSGLKENNHATFKWYPKLNHLMFVGGDPPSPADYMKKQRMNKKMLDELAEWIRSH